MHALTIEKLSLLRNSVFEALVQAYPLHKGKGRWMNLVSDLLRIGPYGYDKPRQVTCSIRLYLDPGDPCERLYFFGLYGNEHLPLLRRLLRPGDCVIDVGANTGWFTALVASIVDRSGRVCSVEANPRLAAKLRRSFADSPNVRIVHAAACATSGTVTFSLATFSGWSSLRPNCTFEVLEQVSVPGTTLDALVQREALSHIRLVKLDIEGGEFGALQGAAEILGAGSVDLILTEVEPIRMRAFGWTGHDLSRRLSNAGYVPVAFQTACQRFPQPIGPATSVPGETAADYVYALERLREDVVHALFAS